MEAQNLLAIETAGEEGSSSDLVNDQDDMEVEKGGQRV